MKLESVQNKGIACICHGYGKSFVGINNAGWEVWTCDRCKSWEVYGVPQRVADELGGGRR